MTNSSCTMDINHIQIYRVQYYAETEHVRMWLFISDTGYKTVKEANASLNCI